MNTVNDDVKQAELLDAIETGAIDNAAPRSLSTEEIEVLVERCKTDAGAAFESETVERLKATKHADLAAFMRLRSRMIEARKIKVSALDRLLGDGADDARKETGQGGAVEFPEVEPWPEPVDGAALFDELTRAFLDFMHILPDAARACALWAVFTHLFELFEHSPRLNIRSPTKRCGKSLLREILERIVARPLPAEGITAAAVFRTIEKYTPTLLLDEVDAFAKDDDVLRGVFNSGHKRGGSIIRTVGEDFEPRRFKTWCPLALVGIGSIADTIEDRSIIISLQRRLPSERGKRYRGAKTPEFDVLARKIARWARDNREHLADADPDMPEALHDRAQDNWRALIAIADLAGGDWPETARAAALALSGAEEGDNAQAGVMLLADIRVLFDGGYDDALNDSFGARTELEPGRTKGQPGFERLASDALARALAALTDLPWATWTRGRPITANHVAKMLKTFGVRPSTIRWGSKLPHGYRRLQFGAAFERYLDASVATKGSDIAGAHTRAPGNPDFEVPTFLQPNKSGAFRAKQSSYKDGGVGTSKTAQSIEFTEVKECRNFETPSPKDVHVCAPESGPSMLLKKQNHDRAPEGDVSTGDCNGARVSTVDPLRGLAPRCIADEIIGGLEAGRAETPDEVIERLWPRQ
jgi:hypothetical protein